MSDLKRLFVCLHEYRRDLILGMVLVLVETFSSWSSPCSWPIS